MHALSILLTPYYHGHVQVVASRRVGFKHFALVTGNDTDPSFVKSAAHETGTVNPAMTLFWRINGVVVFSKGANMIPMDELEGRLDADAHRVLVESAAAAGLNTLRVWGGGMFLPDAWYDACDELGIMARLQLSLSLSFFLSFS